MERAAPRTTTANRDIIDHNKKRIIENKLFELQDAMIEQGFDDEEIESKLAQKRAQLEREASSGDGDYRGRSGTLPSQGSGGIIGSKSKTTDTHAIAEMKEHENSRMRKALGLDRQASSHRPSDESKYKSDDHGSSKRHRTEK